MSTRLIFRSGMVGGVALALIFGGAPAHSMTKVLPTASTRAKLFEAHCLSGSAPVLGRPAFDEHDRVYFTTTDGTLHAFEADGRHRFSYTLEGTPGGQPNLTGNQISLGTSTRALYTIRLDGSYGWRSSAPAPVRSGLVRSADGTLAFVGPDDHLYLTSLSGRPLYRVALGGGTSGDPVGEGRTFWFEGQGQLVRVEGAWRRRTVPFEGPLVLWRQGPAEHLYLLEADRLWGIAPRGEPRSELIATGVTAVGASAFGFAYAQGRELFMSRIGFADERLHLPSPASGEILIGARRVVVTHTDGAEVTVFGGARPERFTPFRNEVTQRSIGRAFLAGVSPASEVCLAALP